MPATELACQLNHTELCDALRHSEARSVRTDMENHQMSRDPIEQRMLSIPEAAIWLGVSERFVYALISRGELRSVKVGRRRLIDTRDAEQFINERKEDRE